jgi:hypothetical protein
LKDFGAFIFREEEEEEEEKEGEKKIMQEDRVYLYGVLYRYS